MVLFNKARTPLLDAKQANINERKMFVIISAHIQAG